MKILDHSYPGMMAEGGVASITVRKPQLFGGRVAKYKFRTDVERVLAVKDGEAQRSGAGAAAGAIVGGLLTGGIGVIAGAAIGGRRKIMGEMFLVVMKDGHRFVVAPEGSNNAWVLRTFAARHAAAAVLTA